MEPLFDELLQQEQEIAVAQNVVPSVKPAKPAALPKAPKAPKAPPVPKVPKAPKAPKPAPVAVLSPREALEKVIKDEGISISANSVQRLLDMEKGLGINASELASSYSKIGNGKGIRITVDANSRHDAWTVKGLYFNPKTNSDNTIIREFKTYKAAKKGPGQAIVDHTLFVLEEAVRGKGIAKSILKQQFETYAKANVAKVTVHAALENGAYTWARFGFLPEADSWKVVFDNAQFTARDIGREAQRFVAQLSRSNPEDIWLLADSKWGKEILSGDHWRGTFDFSNPKSVSRFNAYNGTKL